MTEESVIIAKHLTKITMTRFEKTVIALMQGLMSRSIEGYSNERMVSESFKIAELIEKKFIEREEFNNSTTISLDFSNCLYEPHPNKENICRNCGKHKYEHTIGIKK